MPNQIPSQVEYNVLLIAQNFVALIPEKIFLFPEKIFFLFKAKVEETYPKIFQTFDESSIQKLLQKSLKYAGLKHQIKDSQQEEASKFTNSQEIPEDLEKTQSLVRQQFGLQNFEMAIGEENQKLPLKSSPQSQSLPFQKDQPQNQNVTVNPVSQQISVTAKKSKRIKKKRTDARLGARKTNKNSSRMQRKWPMLYITKENLAESIRQTKKIEELNDRFKRRLKRIINREIRVYKQQLIQQRQKTSKKTQPRIDSFAIRRQAPFNLFFNPIITNPTNWSRDYRLIKIGNLKFTYFINNLLNVQVTDFTFIDRTLELRKAEFLLLKKHKFISRLTGLLPKKRKIHYDMLFTLHRLLA